MMFESPVRGKVAVAILAVRHGGGRWVWLGWVGCGWVNNGGYATLVAGCCCSSNVVLRL